MLSLMNLFFKNYIFQKRILIDDLNDVDRSMYENNNMSIDEIFFHLHHPACICDKIQNTHITIKTNSRDTSNTIYRFSINK